MFLIESLSKSHPFIQLSSRVASKTSAPETDTHMRDPNEVGVATDVKLYMLKPGSGCNIRILILP